jgi:valyl-tRNA synthetase
LARQKQEQNDKVYTLLQRDEQGEDIDIEELTQLLDEIEYSLINPEYRDKLTALLFKKQAELNAEMPEPEESEEETPEEAEENNELTTKIASLIAQTQQALDKNDCETANQLLAEIATHANTSAYIENQALIAKLVQQLANTTSSQLETNNNTNGLLIIS